MKFFLLSFFLLFITCSIFSQNTFDQSLNEISSEIANKLNLKNKKKIVVLYVTDISKTQTVAGKYIADVVSVNIVNDENNFEVFDRENLSGIAEAKKMMAEGYIDANKAKELGKILAVDAIVIGNYTVLSSTLKLTLKALDVNSGLVITASMKDLPITNDSGSLLGISVSSGNNVSNSSTNRGFNDRPLNSNESYNNPETVNAECEVKNTGDFCFENRTNKKLKVNLAGSVITLESGQTQCYYNKKAMNFSYSIDIIEFRTDGSQISRDYSRGNILVEKCKSKTFVIK